MTTELFADNWVWYVPANVTKHANVMADSMDVDVPGLRRRVLIKGGGQGYSWAQWGAYAGIYEDQGIEEILWVYSEPRESEHDIVIGALRKKWSSEVVINCEVEWSNAYGITRDFILKWVEGLRQKIRSVFGKVPQIGFSSVPSWTWFNYEAWSEACDGTEQPQCYFQPWVADQIVPGNQKSRLGARVVVGLPACQQEDAGGQHEVWTDQKINALTDYYSGGMAQLVGFNGWQSGAVDRGLNFRNDFAWNPMKYAYGQLERFASPIGEQAKGLMDLPFNVSDNPLVWHCYLPDGSLDAWVTQSEFIERWTNVGPHGLQVFGLPITGMYLDPEGRKIQYFERARFELNGDGAVSLGLLGTERIDQENRLKDIGLGSIRTLTWNGASA